ncbi:hypothetical protein KJ839_06295, partial [Patescibacteria group bacterium]|nr:hypothetical protein [Patescibacteria group bacterium]
SNPTDPKAFIQNAEKAVNTMKEDPEIAEDYKLPWILRHAAIHNPTDLEAFIQNTEKAVKEMEKDDSIEINLRKRKALLIEAALKYPSNPKEALEKLKEK